MLLLTTPIPCGNEMRGLPPFQCGGVLRDASTLGPVQCGGVLQDATVQYSQATTSFNASPHNWVVASFTSQLYCVFRRFISTLCHFFWEILLPSARHLEERLTVSHSVNQSGKQSVRQSVGQEGRQPSRQKHTVWLFFQWRTKSTTSGERVAHWSNRRSSGRTLEKEQKTTTGSHPLTSVFHSDVNPLE